MVPALFCAHTASLSSYCLNGEDGTARVPTPGSVVPGSNPGARSFLSRDSGTVNADRVGSPLIRFTPTPSLRKVPPNGLTPNGPWFTRAKHHRD